MLKKYTQTRLWRFTLISILLLGLLGSIPIQPVRAASIVVTNTNDNGAGSLRQAIADAVAGDTITFDSSLAGQAIILESELTINKDLSIDGSSLASPISISGNNKVRIFSVGPNVKFDLDSLSIRNGYGSSGGGIYNQGILTIENSTFLQNTANYHVNGLGGGILSVSGALTIKNSTFTRNVAGEGGGLNNNIDNTADLVNVTFTDNYSLGGAGINNHGLLNLTNTTISNNTGMGIYNAGTLNYTNTILANSLGYDCYNDLSGTINVNVKNLVETYHDGWPDVNCGLPAVTGDPLLGPLQDNGGRTQTMALLSGSPAINAGNDAKCPQTDQRGVVRPKGSHCDIGAYELNQTFSDVSESYWAWSYIERLYAAGITSGCSASPLMYCPGATVTRDQMAVFLLRGEHGSSYVPPAATGVFQDVPATYWAASWIEQLATEGITAGCGSGMYCPTNPVARDQMAVFLLRAKYGSNHVPPKATGIFDDVPTNYWAADWIEQLAAEGIAGGCSSTPKLFCPAAPVTRDQMAAFLVKSFNLP